jgi:hypothetical protein
MAGWSASIGLTLMPIIASLKILRTGHADHRN